MRKILLGTLLALSIGMAQGQGEPTVYRTKTGHKYHVAGCSYLRKSQIPIKLSKVKEAGLSPCSKCEPPKPKG